MIRMVFVFAMAIYSAGFGTDHRNLVEAAPFSSPSLSPSSLFGVASSSSTFPPHASAGKEPGIEEEVNLGTTLVAIKYDGGVVVAADSRTSMSSYVSHRYAEKVSAITESCVVCRSGSAADTQMIANAARLHFADRRLRYGGLVEDEPPTVSQVAHWIRSAVYGSGQSEYRASLLVAGYDKQQRGDGAGGAGGGRIFSVLPGGAMLEDDAYAASGSGSTYVLGYLDHTLRGRGGGGGEEGAAGIAMDENDAIELCKRAIALAIDRDGSSGGIVRIFICNQEGIRQMNVYPTSSPSKSTLDSQGNIKNKNLAGFADPVRPRREVE